jgi:hypothetical protein
MAGVTLLAIISFLFLSLVILLLGQRGGPGSQIETVAESRHFGKITNVELRRLRESQSVLDRFLQQLIQNLAIVDPSDAERMRALAPLNAFIQQMMAQTQTNEQLVNIWLVTQYAQKEGLTPDGKDVTELLTDLTGGYISDSVYNDTLQSVGLTHQSAVQLLARHLRWLQMLDRFSLSVEAVTPATRWDWYQRLYRQVTIETAAVPADSLIDHVGEPSNSQLNALFEKYKTKRYDPASAESGFRMPTELAFQYVTAEPSQQMLDSVTEEEMLEFYEKNKDALFLKATRSPADLRQFPGMTPGSVPFPTPGRSSMPTAPMPNDGLPSLPDVPDEENESIPDESAPNTSSTSRTMLRFVSYQAEEEAESATNETAPDEPVDLSVLYKPFDEVKDQIRKELAMNKATEAFPVIQAEMKKYATVYHEHIDTSKLPPPMPDLTGFVAELGLELVTVPMGDVYAALRTNLARGEQERQGIARMFHSVPILFEGETFWGSQSGQVLYWVTAEKKEIRPEKMEDVREIVLKRWKEIEAKGLAQKKAEELASEAKSSGKPLAEVFAGRSDVSVVETEPFTWKSYRGTHPLLAMYQRILPRLGEVREKGVAVGDSLLDNKVIVAPGEDFMETVFSLPIGETGTAMNQPQTVAYVVRVTSSTPSADALWEQFQSMSGMEALGAGQPDMVASALEAWLDDIRSKTGFRWINKPDALGMEIYDDGRD